MPTDRPLPNVLYHGSAYEHDRLKPGYKHSRRIVRWDLTESNKWLYATTQKQMAVLMGLAGAFEKSYGLNRMIVRRGSVMLVTSHPGVSAQDVEQLAVYLYTLHPTPSEGWEHNQNPHNQLTSEWKTTHTVSFVKRERVDLRRALGAKTFQVEVRDEQLAIEELGIDVQIDDNNETLNEDYQEMQEFLELQSDEVQANCKIVTPDMMNCEFALHVDKNVPAEFVPRMPRSAMPSENDTCARVTVAGTVIGCYIGYFRGERDIQDGSAQKPGIKDPFLGGYTISRLDFQHALLPNAELVSDSHSSEELWLVPYNTENVRYKPKAIGKMFVEELTFLPVSGKKPQVRLVLYVQHDEAQGLWLNRAHKLAPGNYKVTIHWSSIWTRDVHDTKGVQVEEVDELVFNEHKQRVAAFLSRHVDQLPNRPVFFGWQ